MRRGWEGAMRLCKVTDHARALGPSDRYAFARGKGCSRGAQTGLGGVKSAKNALMRLQHAERHRQPQGFLARHPLATPWVHGLSGKTVYLGLKRISWE